MHATKRDKFPTDFSVRYFKPGHAWRRATVGPGHAAGIEKQNATTSFIARDMCVTMQENIDVIRLSIRRNVLQSEFQPASRKIDDQAATRNCCRNFRAQRVTRDPIARSSSRIASAQTSPRCQISSASLAISLTLSGRRLCVSARTKMRQDFSDFAFLAMLSFKLPTR